MRIMPTGSPEANPPVQKERKKPGRVPTSCAECRRYACFATLKAQVRNAVRTLLMILRQPQAPMRSQGLFLHSGLHENWR